MFIIYNLPKEKGKNTCTYLDKLILIDKLIDTIQIDILNYLLRKK